jgi:TonB family protein
MFETSVIREHAIPADRRAGLVTLSVAFHSFIALGAIGMALTNLRLPTHSPNQLASFQTTPVVELPQPKGKPDGTGNGKPKAAVAPVRQMPAQPVANLAPANVPDAIPQVQPQTTGDSDATSLTARTDTGGTGPSRGIKDGDDDAIDIGQPLVETPAAAPEAPLAIRGDVKAPVIVSRVTPAYPEAMRRSRLSGAVRIRCIIDKQGNIRDAEVTSSSFAGFEQSALAAVRQWRFVAGSLHGRPVDTIFELTVTFTVR